MLTWIFRTGLLVLCFAVSLTRSGLAVGPPPHVAREFRAAWIATVANIDWPSKPGLTPNEQRKELLALLDLASDLRMNAVVFQVRPACDALYASQLEPWSEYLTGVAGQAPPDRYDPLAFAVDEAHRRGLELHAWLNPYRAAHPTAKSPLPTNHISNTQPGIVKQYGKYLWLDPGSKAAEQHTRSVILDVVERYDIDAIHFDDYFYPYPIVDDDGAQIPFPDEESWADYLSSVSPDERLSQDDWRRKNVNRLLQTLAIEIKRLKPWVRFGVSPFGIYRPGQPEQIRGFDAYTQLYADSKKWLVDGTVDYLSPQLYWPIDQRAQSFPVLLDWWRAQNRHGRHVWPGLYTSKVLADDAGWPAEEIAKQIEIVRGASESPGHIHFSIKAIQQNRSGLRELLQESVYREAAIPPATPWCELPDAAPLAASLRIQPEGRESIIRFQVDQGARPWLWVVQYVAEDRWQTRVVPGSSVDCTLPVAVTSREQLVVRPVDRLNQMGPAVNKLQFQDR